MNIYVSIVSFSILLAANLSLLSCSLSPSNSGNVQSVTISTSLSSSEIENPFLLCEYYGSDDYYNHITLQDMLKSSYPNTQFTKVGNWPVVGSSTVVTYSKKIAGTILVSGTISYTIKPGSSGTVSTPLGNIPTNIDTYDVDVDISFENYKLNDNFEYKVIKYSLKNQKYNDHNKPTTYTGVTVSINGKMYLISEVIFPKAT